VPAFNVTGKIGLTIVNPVPVTVPAHTVVVPVPGFESVTIWVTVVPTTALPNQRVVGEAVIIPAPDVAVAPVPVMVKEVDGFIALDVKETVPVAVPSAVGENDSVSGTLLPAFTVSGN
jgi:hypothetical protein